MRVAVDLKDSRDFSLKAAGVLTVFFGRQDVKSAVRDTINVLE